MKQQPIFVIGFMGAGKTTFGKKLAAQLQRSFIDLDAEIVARYRQQEPEVNSIAEIIAQNGLPYFRMFESETLQLLPLQNQVVATGGGTPCYYDGITRMKSRGVVLYLAVPEGVLLSRLKSTELSERPLLKDKDENELKQFIKTELQLRLAYYEQAHIQVNPVKETLSEIAALLAKAVN